MYILLISSGSDKKQTNGGPVRILAAPISLGKMASEKGLQDEEFQQVFLTKKEDNAVNKCVLVYKIQRTKLRWLYKRSIKIYNFLFVLLNKYIVVFCLTYID